MIGKFDVWEVRGNVSHLLVGPFEVWPANIQDVIYAAIMKSCKPKIGYELRIVASGCEHIPGELPSYRVTVQEFPPDPRRVQ